MNVTILRSLEEPISESEVRAHSQIARADDRDAVLLFAASARAYAESVTNRCLHRALYSVTPEAPSVAVTLPDVLTGPWMRGRVAALYSETGGLISSITQVGASVTAPVPIARLEVAAGPIAVEVATAYPQVKLALLQMVANSYDSRAGGQVSGHPPAIVQALLSARDYGASFGWVGHARTV
jgi:hypothetical protein